MIGQLTGNIAHTDDRFVILNVGGVGYKIFTTAESMIVLAKNSEEVTLWTHLIVKEDALDLYGFVSQQELNFFELLITVSGIGPKSALGVLSLAGVETLCKAISSNNTEYLTKVAGVGRKSAEKIVLELKDKLGKLGDFLPTENLDKEADVLNALEALGYSIREAREAIKKIPAGTEDTGEKIKQALKQLSH
jgi:holliday junction DNA helicase RuvA